MRICALWIVLLVVLVGSGSTIAQEPDFAVADVVEVNVVNVDVVVTDRDGNAVHGLTRDDFEVREDGDRVELINFLEIANRSPVVTPLPGSPSDTAAQPVVAPPDPVTIVLYFDNSTLISAHRNRVLGELRDFVTEAAVPGNTRFMVVAFNPGLDLVEPLTGDPVRVVAALERIADMPAAGLLAERDRQSTRDHVQSIYVEVETSKGYGSLDGEPGEKRGKESAATQGTRSRFFDVCTEAWGSMLNAVDSFAQAQNHRVELAQAGLTDLTRSLVGVPGRKVVLYMSDGLAQIPGLLEYKMLEQICPDRTSEIFSYYNRFERAGAFGDMTALANLNRVTFYALDTTGLSGLKAASASSDDRRFTASFRTQTEHQENLRASLFTIADETGGRAFFNANQPGPELERMARDYSNFYSLGFNPQQGWDGEVHKLKVSLTPEAGKGYRILYRTRYRAMSQEERVAERTLAALVLGLEENPLGVELRALGSSRLDDGRYLVPLQISVSKDRITSLPADGARQGQLRLVLAIQGAEGEVGAFKEMVVPVELPAIAGPGDDSRHSMVIRVPLDPGSERIALAVEDRLGSITSYVRADVDLPAAEADAKRSKRRRRG